MIKLLSTDFDGTLFAEFESPPIPGALMRRITGLQAEGVKWVINTGRDMSGIMEALGRSDVEARPDYLILVEREIHELREDKYTGWAAWNDECRRAHDQVFERVRADLPRLTSWVHTHCHATVYEDAYSPFCILAGNHGDADAIHEFMEDYCREVPDLQVVRNDVYARFAHAGYNKGTTLAELARHLEIGAENIFAAGDHFNDLAMLQQRYARYLASPANAIEPVKTAVRAQGGFVGELNHGHGTAQGLEFFLRQITGGPA